MDKGKIYANKGVARNKKPLQNIVIVVELNALKENVKDKASFDKYKFKDLGYITCFSGLEKDYNRDIGISWLGFLTPDELKLRLGDKQWTKFCNGKRKFIIQRRVDGKNVKKK